MIYDIFTFNGEYDLLEIRLNILNDYVDKFIIVEATTTFSGKDKPLYYEKEKARYKKWESKIKYHIVRPEDEEKYVALANVSPNTRGASHWKKEFCQKECIKDALVGLDDNDICFIGDCDEIWKPDILSFIKMYLPLKARLLVYSYYLNNFSNEVFWGTLIAKYETVKEDCLNHLRSDRRLYWTKEYLGWHFTSMGGYEEVKRKLSDSYTRESYWTNEVENNLKENVENSKDFLGRGFTYKIDESELPKYLLDNKDKYKHLWRQ